ncbi:MAG: hypothetical protein Q7K45_05085 [Nanoarchaeota archaeon]|nr:hypothetical protein [Nanoarchaeota archaeon]
METNYEKISGKIIPVTPLIHSPPFAYSSESIMGEQHQEKMFLRMVATPSGALYYDATRVVPLYRSPIYVPMGFSMEKIKTTDIDTFLAYLVNLALNDTVEPVKAKELNLDLYHKLEHALLPAKTKSITELPLHDRF